MIRAAASALILSLAGLFPLLGQAQQPSNAAKPGLDAIAQARAALRKAEADHPDNTVEVAKAMDDLISLQLDGHFANEETLALATREAAVSEAASGPRSKLYVNALGELSEAYIALSRPAEGRPYAEKALAIAEKEFPGTEEWVEASDEVSFVCAQLADYPTALRLAEAGIAAERKIGGNDNWNLVSELTNLQDLKLRMRDIDGAGAAGEESLAIALRTRPNDPQVGTIENNLGSFYVQTQQFAKAIPHLNRAVELNTKLYGPGSPLVLDIQSNIANLYSRTGQFDLAWKNYEATLSNVNQTVDSLAQNHAIFARSLASGGNPTRAIAEGLTAARMGRESFQLQARILPERQALAYAAQRPRGVDTAISVLLRHPELATTETYQEIVRSRALVADEMAIRQKNLNASNDPEVARLLNDLSQARTDLLSAEGAVPAKENRADILLQSTQRMEQIERVLAEKSAAIRSDERINAVLVEDLHHNLPAHSVLVSYVIYTRRAVDKVDPANSNTVSYAAFVLHPDSDRICIFDLGEARPIHDAVTAMRAAADAEAHGGGLGSTRNERNYRQAGEALRKLIWDPLKPELGDAKLALVVPDANLNLIPFAGLPEGNGYLVEHGPVIHILTSERDLLPVEGVPKKTGLLALGSPQFELTENASAPSPLRDASASCEQFRNLQFHPLPGSGQEVTDIISAWRRWNGNEPSVQLTGAEATEGRFIQAASQTRVLHVATHAFLLDSSCGNGNPLLHSGLVFAGANENRDASILTAQQIAGLNLSGVDWAVLSACNTGNGELHDGEGVLGLERAFRVAGARSVVMTLWPVDDDVTRQFMHELYTDRLERHATTADAVWSSARKLLLARRAAGKSTHPWYWAGFVGAGGWE